MRIGIEAQRVLRPNRHGMDVVALNLIHALLSRDRDNEYIVYIDRPDTDNVLGEWENLSKRVVRAPGYPLWEQLALPLAARQDRLDVLHLTSNTAPVVAPTCTVVTLHDVIFLKDTDPQAGQGSWYQRLGRVYRRWNVPRTAPRADRLLTVSDYERHQINAAIPDSAGRVGVVYNGVGEVFWRERSAAEVAAACQAHGAPERFVLFLGNTAPKKNTDRVLAAWCRAREAGLALPLVITDLSEAEIDRRLQRVDGLAHRDHIVAPGYVPQEALACLYRQATVFLYPSLAESFGMPILEAMACGAPVITSATTAMPEIAGDAAVLVDPVDVGAMASALVALVADDARCRQLARRGAERAAGFRWDSAAQAVLATYRDVVAARRAA